MKDNVGISVLLPTRGRTHALERSIMSLVDTASDIDSIELLLGYDQDDQPSSDWFVDNLAGKLDIQGLTYTVMEFQPMGYIRLNEYVNALARESEGDWLVFWNDDAVMKTTAWDTKIMAHTGNFRVLRMPTHRDHPYAIFPIVPRQWFELFGYLSDHQISDAWISQIAYMVDIMHNIDIEVLHDRHDITGNNNDTTFANRPMLEGNPLDPRDFNHGSWRRRRFQDASKIYDYLVEINQATDWFQRVRAGKQDPWQRMLSPEYDPNKQLGVWK